MFSMSLSSNSTILLAFRDDNLRRRRPWNYRQGRSTRLTGSSTPACIDDNFNIWSYGKVTPFRTPHGNQLHIYKMLQRPFKPFINSPLKNLSLFNKIHSRLCPFHIWSIRLRLLVANRLQFLCPKLNISFCNSWGKTYHNNSNQDKGVQ